MGSIISDGVSEFSGVLAKSCLDYVIGEGSPQQVHYRVECVGIVVNGY